MENNTNFQTFHQMGQAINDFVKQATGRDNVQNIDMDHITVAQNHFYQDVDVSGRVVSFHAGAAGLPLEKCVVQIEPVQDLHGYDHPWPAGGGVNHWNYVEAVASSGAYGLSNISVNSDGLVTISGTYNRDVVSAQIGIFLNSGTPFIENQKFLVFDTNTDATNTLRIVRWLNPTTGGIAVDLVNLTNGTSYNIQFKILMCDDSITPTSWTPYSNICPITGWTAVKVYRAGQNLEDATVFEIAMPAEAGTVYGGTLDVVSGELVVEYKYYTENGSGAWAEVTAGGNRWVLGGVTGDAKENDTSGVCNIGKIVNAFRADGVVVQSNGRINLCGSLYSAFASVTDLKSYLAEHPIQLVYKLQTSVSYTLTPTEITTLLGVNNIWSDAGDIEVKFKDLKELY